MKMNRLTIAVPPEMELVALVKTSMKGKFVGVDNAALISPKQNRSATTMANPSIPLRSTETHMLRGMTVDAFSTSSALMPYQLEG
jgi:hypothetical protein